MAGHDGYTRYTVRIPDALYERVKAAAGEKSVNAEIVATLEEKYPALPSFIELVALVESAAEQLKHMEKGPEWYQASIALVDLIDAIKLAIPRDDDPTSDPKTASPFDQSSQSRHPTPDHLPPKTSDDE